MQPIVLRKLRREFGGVVAVNDVDLQIPAGSMFFMLGPSGCGKTTILRMIAGFQEPSGGQVLFGERDVTRLPAEKRDAGMVFQSYALWPHMTVFDNVAFGLQVRKVPAAEQRTRVMQALEMVRMQAYADRRPNQLSGGQQQRVALARAIVFRPEVLLLDEPLSNLDAKLRERMRFEIKRLQRELGLTTIYVTHDQSEALALSHEIAVMSEGRIVQIGSPRDIYERPCNRFVADFVGSTNFVDAVVAGAGAEPHLYQAQSAIGLLTVYSVDPLRAGDAILVSIRPEDVAIGVADLQGPNVVAGTVDLKVFLGEAVDFQIRVGERQLLARAHPSVAADVGSRVSLRMQPKQCISIRGDR